jgi:hypothetical protein
VYCYLDARQWGEVGFQEEREITALRLVWGLKKASLGNQDILQKVNE